MKNTLPANVIINRKMLTWLKFSALESMIDLSAYFQPNEIGGCLLGYWVTPLEEVVICEIIGPGPNAKYSGVSFNPDAGWQERKIAEIYKKSGQLHTYLGDWHSHPNHPSANLSWKDKRTLRRIASYSPARMPNPLMAIVSNSDDWKLKIWCLELKDYKIISLGKKHEFDEIKIFGEPEMHPLTDLRYYPAKKG